MDLTLRIAVQNDLPAIVEIYNQAIRLQTATADLSPVSVERQKTWFTEHAPDTYPIFLAEKQNNVAGWCSISPYRAGRMALRHTAEISLFVHESDRREGVGSALLKHAVRKCEQIEIRTLFAIVLDVNIPSVNLLETFGFQKWGHMPNIADFDGKECGHLYYGLRVIP